jgi:hypothetical protein
MRGIVTQVLSYIGQRIWPSIPPGPPLKPMEEEKQEANRAEAEVRAELVRAQTEAMRFRAMTGRD